MLQDRTWLLIGRKMANEATPGEIQELEELLKNNPELHFALHTISGISHQNPSENYLQIDRAYSAHLKRMKEMGMDVPGSEEEQQFPEAAYPVTPIPQRRSLKKALVAGLSLTAVIAVIIILINPSTPSAKQAEKLQSEISTRNGSKTYIILPDGTKVWLNSGSKVTYDKKFGETKREVILTGEAYFDVAHNADKPFVIHTQAMDIRVLGTEFNVRSYPDENTTETSLIRGSIEVTLKDKRAEKIILKPNEKLVVSNESDSVAEAPEKERKPEPPIISLSHLNYFSLDSTVLETSWVQNRLVFEDESFTNLAKRMERWYGVKFVFESDDVQQLRFTGNFKEESIQEALEAMKITAKFNYVINNNIITITNN
jgi:ferric-dicitrate binding protein FerR (iron transport regulator)